MSELEDILNYLETTSLEPHDDYVSEFSYKEQKLLWAYIKELQQENQELKKQLEASRRVAKHHLNRELELENQQKDFIKYLEDEIKRLEENNIYQSLQRMALETHKHNLSKYKEITGVKDERIRICCIDTSLQKG